MNDKEMERRIIEQYQQDEQIMILIFAQWCINKGLDPFEVYEKAYPVQKKNPALVKAIEQTVSKEEADIIADETLINVLQLFGNDDLAFAVTEAAEQKPD